MSLPDVQERPSYGGRPSWRTPQRMFTWVRDDPEALVVWVDSLERKETMLAGDSVRFFTTEHYDGQPIVLVRLDAVDREDAEELVVESWRERAPKRSVRSFDELDALGPIGLEPRIVTLAAVRQDAYRRGIAVGQAWSDRRSAVDEIGSNLEVWSAAITEVELDGEWVPATEAASRLGVVLALVTSDNPLAHELTAGENAERMAQLLEEMGHPLRSRGRAPDGGWEEYGVAVPFDRAALDAAQRWGQAAVYRVTSESVEVVVVVGESAEALTARLGD